MAKTFAALITFLVSFSVLYFLVYVPNAAEINKKFGISFTNNTKSEKTVKSSVGKKKSIPKGSPAPKTATVIDSYKGVDVFYNGAVRNVFGRNVSKDGYNLGLRYQCVEFVKRFYYQAHNHKMPDSYGHAKEFFKSGLGDGDYNSARGMYQFKNGSQAKPKADDLIVFGAAPYNSFGHVAVISGVGSDYVEIVQQNPGKGNPSRAKYKLTKTGNTYKIEDPYVKGWLRL